MQIEGIRLSTGNVSLSADRINGRQLFRALDRLVGATETSVAPGGSLQPAQPPGPGAVRRPSDEFAATSVALAADPSSGFAAGGASQLARLDTRGVLDLIMRFMQQLVVALMQMLMAGEGQGTGGSGQSSQPGQSGGCGSGAPAPGGGGTTQPPATPPAGSTGGLPSGSAPPLQPAPALPSLPTGGAGLTTPPRNGSPGACEPQPRTGGCGSRPRTGVGRILARIGKDALGIAAGAATGGPLGAALAGAGSVRGAASSSPGCGLGRTTGGSLEDQIASFFRAQLKQVEGELQGAMQEAQAGGNGGEGGDSRAMASSKVQQLVQKRSEMIEMLTNSLKTSHETALTVARNLK